MTDRESLLRADVHMSKSKIDSPVDFSLLTGLEVCTFEKIGIFHLERRESKPKA
jgi:hypothetical protein